MIAANPSRPSPPVAVVIAAYNAQAFVATAIRSALAQPEASEVWVVDDASTDATVTAAESCDDGTGRLRIVRLGLNGGPAAARNVALAATRADWICVLDADDQFRQGRLAALLSEAGEADMVADAITRLPSLCDASISKSNSPMDESGWRTISLAEFIEGNVSRPGAHRQELGFIKPIMSTAFLRARKICYDPRLRLGEDFLLYAEVLAHGGRLKLGPPCGYLALTRADSLSGRHTIHDLESLRNATLALEDIRRLTSSERKALRRHWRSVDNRLQWRRLIQAVKSRDIAAAAAAFHDPAAAANLVGKLSEEAWLRAKRRLVSAPQKSVR